MSETINISSNLLISDTRPYVLWRRVSTEKQGESGLGLEAQLTIAKLYTRREPVRIYTDVYSGTKLRECVGLWQAISDAKEHNWLLVIAKTDRFRNVKEALEVLDAVGEGNLSFCDMPTVNRMILTIMFSVWESQAMMGRINTRLALAERKRQIKENGGWVSNTGKWRTKLGREKGVDNSEAVACASKKRTEAAREWRENSIGYKWVKRQIARGVPRKEVIEEFNANMDMGVPGFGTVEGHHLTQGVLTVWIREMFPQV